jgi:hypothetical protein
MKLTILFISYFFVWSALASVQLPALMSYPQGHEKNISVIHKNKVLVFLNRTCPCTQQNIPYINQLVKEFPEIEFIGVHSKKGSGPQEIKEVIENYKPDFPVIDDNNLEIANILKANRTPQVVVLNDKNDILYNGGVTDRTNPKNASKLYLKNALADISAHREVAEKETRSLGCIILR